jgi:hypothetical protein
MTRDAKVFSNMNPLGKSKLSIQIMEYDVAMMEDDQEMIEYHLESM